MQAVTILIRRCILWVYTPLISILDISTGINAWNFGQNYQQTIFLNICLIFFFFFFFFFSRKQDLTFHTNCLQTNNLYEISNPVFWEKSEKKNIMNLSSAEFVYSGKS